MKLPIKYIIKSFTYQCCIFIFKLLRDIINHRGTIVVAYVHICIWIFKVAHELRGALWPAEQSRVEDKKICLLIYRRTIGMSRTDGVVLPLAPAGHFQHELDRIVKPSCWWDALNSWRLVEFSPLLDSSNITYVRWNMIAESIASRYDDYDGFDRCYMADTIKLTAPRHFPSCSRI